LCNKRGIALVANAARIALLDRDVSWHRAALNRGNTPLCEPAAARPHGIHSIAAVVLR
jgi:hypothetical protein